MKAVLRKVGGADLDQLHQIVVDTFVLSFAHLNDPEDFKMYVSQNLSKSQLYKELNNVDSLFYFVLLDEVVTGYLKLNRRAAQTEQYLPNALEIERIYILPQCQGLGIGKLMINKAKEIAIEEQYPILWLGVWEENKAAIRFYKREGFDAFDKHTFLLGSDVQTDLMMKMDI